MCRVGGLPNVRHQAGGALGVGGVAGVTDVTVGAALGDLLLVGDPERACLRLGQGLHRPDAQG